MLSVCLSVSLWLLPIGVLRLLSSVWCSTSGELALFQADFKLMCDNAMTYNRPDTGYYKLAQKILHAGFKMMSKVRGLRWLAPGCG